MSDGVLRVRLAQAQPISLSVDFACGPGDVVAIFGPSGTGKTTILRSIAGLYEPVEARVALGDTVWTDSARRRCVPAYQRPVGFVFQDYALFPHLTAAGNVTLALSDLPARARAARAAELLARVHLHQKAGSRPRQLSGGERQRVGLARALARQPRVLLLDEPFAALDRPTRRRLRADVDQLRRELDVPTILVTHDLDDVVAMATHLLVLDHGTMVAFDALSALLARPDLRQLRDLIGVGSLIEATVVALDEARGLTTLAFAGGTLIAPLSGSIVGQRVRVRIPAREVILADRAPEGLSLHNAIRGTVTAMSASPTSPFVVVQLTAGATPLLAEVTRDAVERMPVAVGRELFALVKSVALEL